MPGGIHRISSKTRRKRLTVLNTGGDFARLIDVLSSFGTPATLGFEAKVPLRKNLSLRGYYYTEVTDDPAALLRAQGFLAAGIASGIIAPKIDRCFALEEIVQAHAYLESGLQFGKIVVRT